MKNKLTFNNTAFNLIELLLTTALSSCILTVLIHFTFQLYVVYLKHQQLITIQNAFLVTRYHLTNDIRSAGFNGCHKPLEAKQIINNVAANYDLNIVKSTTANTCSAGVDCTTMVSTSIQQLIKQQKIPAKSTILILYNVPQNFAYLGFNMHNVSDALSVQFTQAPHPGDILEIHDWVHADRFSVSNIFSNQLAHAWPQNKQTFNHAYTIGSQIFRPSIIAYYIRSTPSHKGKFYTLYRDDFQRNAVALVTGITNFSVQIISNPQMLIKCQVTFANQHHMEIICSPRNKKVF